MKPIGGFFELEYPPSNKQELHHDTLFLSSGRACLHLIIKEYCIKKILLPAYCCDTLLQSIKLTGIDYEYYPINNSFEPANKMPLNNGDFLLYINYFGIKTNAINKIQNQYSNQLILDYTQAFFEPLSLSTPSFNVARKFFGVPDGAYVSGINLNPKLEDLPEQIPSYDHLIQRLAGYQQLGYKSFIKHEEQISAELNKGSKFSRKILRSIDYQKISQKRKENFQFIDQELREFNTINLSLKLEEKTIPFCYPYLPKNKIDRSLFFEQKIFIPILWPDVLDRPKQFVLEKDITERLLPLPIDHRLNQNDLERMIYRLKQVL